MKKKTSATRVQTRIPGVFYKEIISDNGKVVDKVYGIRYVDADGKERLKTIGKHSEGIREALCKQKRDEIVTKIRLGKELPPQDGQSPDLYDRHDLQTRYQKAALQRY